MGCDTNIALMGSSVESSPLQLASFALKKMKAENEMLLLLLSHASSSCPTMHRASASGSRRDQRQHGDSCFSLGSSTAVLTS